MSLPRRGLAVAVTAGSVVGFSVAGARPQEPPQPTFRTEANYVRVDVYPTASGAPVTDLRRDDFEVLEDNVVQPIDTFEHVTIRGGMPQELRGEPNTVAESRAMLENGRARVFVLFLDTGHVEPAAARAVRQPLVNALNRLIGADDLVGVMTAEMAATDVTFARRTTTIEGLLTRYWWGERDRVTPTDPREQDYRICYPGWGPSPDPRACQDDDRGVADEMIARRHEKLTLDALEDLVAYLRGAREERKAVLVISDGWRLYRPNPALARRLNCSVPLNLGGVDPRNGRLTTKPPDGSGANRAQCESDRMALAAINDDDQFRLMLDKANRANVAFYPIDPRGLVVFDTPIGGSRTGLPPPNQPTITPPSVDNAILRARQGTLRDLAAATDGLAVIGTNDLDAGMRRITADLSSYYLLGYYSTGKLDGRFHSIRVRVKRPGVQVRARRGYLAATAAEVTRAAAAAAAPTGAWASGDLAAIAAAISSLSGLARDTALRVATVGGWKPDGSAALWTVGEVSANAEWKLGADVDLMLATAAGQTVATAREHLAPGARSFRVALHLNPAEAASHTEYALRVRAVPAGAGILSGDVLRVSLPDSPSASGAVAVRRGPTTGNRDVPTADLRFRRSEQLRVEVPAPAAELDARLLDRTGKPLPVPVITAARQDADGTRWQTAQVALAPLAPGDYVIELAGRASGVGRADAAGEAGRAGRAGEAERVLVAFRVVP